MAVTIIAFSLFSCSLIMENSILSYATGIAVSGNNIYISGYWQPFKSFDAETACYWKNGKRYDLISGGKANYATGIAVCGSDVYVIGFYDTGGYYGYYVNCYWKNNKLYDFPGFNKLKYITASNTDVYIVGEYYNNNKKTACYWKDDVWYDLTSPLDNTSVSSAIIHDSILYVSGQYYHDESTQQACYWKDGIFVNLGDSVNRSETSSIAVFGTDIYVIGSFNDPKYRIGTSCYWKNGLRHNTDDDTNYEFVVASDSNIYISGTYRMPDNDTFSGYRHHPVYWKNFKRFSIDDKDANYIYGIAVSNSDVYLSGTYGNKTKSQGACYWKNGKMFKLDDK